MEANPLDDLFAEALASRRPGEFSLKAADLTAIQRKYRRLWQDPSNWLRAGPIELLDSASGLSLGVFGEYFHRKLPNTRKLLRENGPAERKEWVSGLGRKE